VHADGYEYSAFCDHYRAWRSTQNAVLRQTHAPGVKLFVDYAGATAKVVDPHTGEIRQAQIFVAVLGSLTLSSPHESLIPSGQASGVQDTVSLATLNFKLNFYSRRGNLAGKLLPQQIINSFEVAIVREIQLRKNQNSTID
jgi:hypothetical protein